VSRVISLTRALVASLFGGVPNQESEFVEISLLIQPISLNGTLLVGFCLE
jgi:hypothetical protein